MALIFRPHVWSLASGLGQATGFDSPVGVPAFYLFAAALDVRPCVAASRTLGPSLSRPAIHAPSASLHETWGALLLLLSLPMPHG